MFKRVLIANRGEIAIRVARAASALGVESVSVYAPADALSLHTRVTTESRVLGMSAVPSSDPVRAYLDIDGLIEAAKATRLRLRASRLWLPVRERRLRANDASKRASRSSGRAPETLALFGDKTKARELARSLGIPIIPGSRASRWPVPKMRMALAKTIGYPVMLKAAAGGGGRGMRAVASADEMAAAFARCQSEAQAAFGDGSVFVEKLLARPRHIEVQVLADTHGNIVHLYERDCSIQLRNQKVVEIAPAPGLDAQVAPAHPRRRDPPRPCGRLRERRHSRVPGQPRARRILFHRMQSAHPGRAYRNRAGHRHRPGRGAVPHRRRRVAESPGAQPIKPPSKRRAAYAVQARIVAGGAGTLTAYKEPTGPGVRVDSCGYLGYAPPPQFDPMFAKLICQSNSTNSFASALDHTLRALDEFHIAGLPTNLKQLRAVLSHPALRAGDARTTLFSEHADLATPVGAQASASGSLALLEQQASALRGGRAALALNGAHPATTGLTVPSGEEGVESPMAGAIIELGVESGDSVEAGDTLMVISAMKMETAITAPCAGVVTGISPDDIGAIVAAGQIVATIAPTHHRTATRPRRASTARTPGRRCWPRCRRCRTSPIAASRPTRRIPAWSASAIAAS